MNGMLVNGQPAETIDLMDRGLHYGDGLFETLACSDGSARLLAAHLQRMQCGCKRLKLHYPGDKALTSDIQALIGDETGNRVVKLMLTRGSGRRGYRYDPAEPVRRIVIATGWPAHVDAWRRDGIRVKYCDTPVTENAQLAGIKHLNRLDSVLAAAELGNDYDEGLLCKPGGRIVEGTMSNLCAVIKGVLCTPSTSTCGIDGVMRDIVMAIAADMNLRTSVVELNREELEQASEIFVTNSILGVCPVVRLNDRALQPGAVTRELQQEISDKVCIGQFPT